MSVMLRGIYSAANAMRYRAHEVDVTANNIANITTDGYKADRTALRSFANILVSRINDPADASAGSAPVPVGSINIGGCAAESTFIDFSPGPPKATGNPLDLCLYGPGFFAVQTPGGTRYTRAGAFSLNNAGEIVDSDGNRLLGADGNPIRITSPAPVTINFRGQITQNNLPVAQIAIVEFSDLRGLEKEGSTFFKPVNPHDTPSPAVATTVEQGAIEGSNVSPVESLVQLIAAQRAYEAASRAVDMFNESMTKVSGELGRLPA